MTSSIPAKLCQDIRKLSGEIQSTMFEKCRKRRSDPDFVRRGGGIAYSSSWIKCVIWLIGWIMVPTKFIYKMWCKKGYIYILPRNRTCGQ